MSNSPIQLTTFLFCASLTFGQGTFFEADIACVS